MMQKSSNNICDNRIEIRQMSLLMTNHMYHQCFIKDYHIGVKKLIHSKKSHSFDTQSVYEVHIRIMIHVTWFSVADDVCHIVLLFVVDRCCLYLYVRL